MLAESRLGVLATIKSDGRPSCCPRSPPRPTRRPVSSTCR
ncbi:MAG TPA: hypothetical protein VNA67_04045 [Pseudonocardiaceae bacterium]|nr:hypothetical protein [Pseudonocardiaceae bacterium]